jgi:hypothetical protein
MPPTEHPVQAAQRRLSHAAEHLDELDRQVEEFMASDPFGLEEENDEDAGHFVVRGRIRAEPPAELGLVLGDAVHSMRAALDNLFWGFALLHRSPPPDRAAFPVFKDSEKWAQRSAKILESVSTDVGEVIRSLQPCVRHPTQPEGDALWVLTRLWNDDKHRRVVPSVSAIDNSLINVGHLQYSGKGPARVLPRARHNGLFADGDVLGEFRYTPGSEYGVGFHFQMYVALPADSPAPGAPIQEVRHLHGYVLSDVLPKFSQL